MRLVSSLSVICLYRSRHSWRLHCAVGYWCFVTDTENTQHETERCRNTAALRYPPTNLFILFRSQRPMSGVRPASKFLFHTRIVTPQYQHRLHRHHYSRRAHLLNSYSFWVVVNCESSISVSSLFHIYISFAHPMGDRWLGVHDEVRQGKYIY